MADPRDKFWGFAYGAGLALVLIVCGAVGLVAEVFWLPTHRMRRSVEGGAARLMGGIALALGVALLIRLIYALCETDGAPDPRPSRGVKTPRKAADPIARRKQDEEVAAAGYLGLNEEARSRKEGRQA